MSTDQTRIHVAENLRRRRRAEGLSQSALSDAAGVSRRMIVSIEKGDVNVSLNTLDRLSEALGVALHALISPPDRPDASHIDEIAWAGRVPESRGWLLASTPAQRQVELWDWSLGAGDCYIAEADPLGWYTTVVVVAGVLDVVVDEETTTVATGGFHVFASHRPYRFENTTPETVRFVRNVVY